MQLDEVRYEVVGEGVATITLDRPGSLNAISARTGGTRDQIVHAITLAEADDLVGGVVLRGAGKAFSGGGDLTGNAARETPAEHRAFIEQADAFHARVRASTVPIVAAVHGYCIGAALALAASCDIVIAGADARFGFPEGRLGMVGVSAVAPVIGRQWAKFLMITGELIVAEQARDIGLVLTVEPDDEVQARALDLAARIARMPRTAVLLNRRTVDAVLDAGGAAAGRAAALDGDTETAIAADAATAPDGRTFRSIIDTEGLPGVKAARDAQYTDPWLR